MRSPSFVLRLTVAAKSQVSPIRSAEMNEQNWLRGVSPGFPRAIPGFIPELWLSTKALHRPDHDPIGRPTDSA